MQAIAQRWILVIVVLSLGGVIGLLCNSFKITTLDPNFACQLCAATLCGEGEAKKIKLSKGKTVADGKCAKFIRDEETEVTIDCNNNSRYVASSVVCPSGESRIRVIFWRIFFKD